MTFAMAGCVSPRPNTLRACLCQLGQSARRVSWPVLPFRNAAVLRPDYWREEGNVWTKIGIAVLVHVLQSKTSGNIEKNWCNQYANLNYRLIILVPEF